MKNKIILVILISSMLYLLVISIKPSHSKLSKTANSKNTIILKTSSMQYNFDYTGGEQTFIAPKSGKYKLETWGAQGGSWYDSCNSNAEHAGGYGGYSVGYTTLSSNSTINIVVGGQGTIIIECEQQENNPSNKGSNGGYNGGGHGGAGIGTLFVGAPGGGGATHIALSSGILSSFVDNKNNVLIVSGGGGGAGLWNGVAGSAGGITGNNGFSGGKSYATGGTQNNGYAFGIGQDGGNGTGYAGAASGHGGGGGGWYGGFAIPTVQLQESSGGGAGGSGYIGNTSLTDKHMTCYNCETSNEESTKTISNTCASETPTSDCSKIGNGYARITYLGK